MQNPSYAFTDTLEEREAMNGVTGYSRKASFDKRLSSNAAQEMLFAQTRK